jgi:hypothetical protein
LTPAGRVDDRRRTTSRLVELGPAVLEVVRAKYSLEVAEALLDTAAEEELHERRFERRS